MLELNSTNFEQEVLQSDIPVLVDFWAVWCGPCQMLGPILEELSNDYSGKLKIAKVNVDENQGLAAKYRVMSIPALLLFKDGELVKQQIGYMPKEKLIENLLTDI